MENPGLKGSQQAQAVRRAARENRWPGTTRGAAPGQVQCNVVILPGEDAAKFAKWCERNPSVAPIIARTEPGNPLLPTLGNDIDLRIDLPAYRLFENGEDAGEADDIRNLWQPDWQGFAFGCSFSLEDALRAGGIPLDYEQRGFGGAIYLTNLETNSSGPYSGPLVVSMRPIPAAYAAEAVALCRRFPSLHGAPVHVGDPAAIGIELDRPLQSLGDISVLNSETPVFWACGVTTQYVIQRARPSRAVTHVSSRMLVTDLRVQDLEIMAPTQVGAAP